MLPWLSFDGRRSIPIFRQAETGECGLACLGMIAVYHGHDLDLAAIRRRFPISITGLTLRTLIEQAAALQLRGRAVRCEVEDIGELRTPAILHWDLKHFVVLKKVRKQSVEIHDPAVGARIVPLRDLSAHFTGVALELTPDVSFEPKRDKNPLRLADLITLPRDTKKAFVQALVLSLLVESFVLATPLYLQLVIDQAILRGDLGILAALASAFGAVVVFKVASTVLRSLTLQFVSSVVAFDVAARVFHHLLRLPLDWFQKRHIGDVQSRFRAIQPVQAFIAYNAIGVLFDGFLSILIFALMLYYSALLTTIVVGSLIAYGLIRFATLQIARVATAERVVADAREQSRFLESVRAISTIKAAGIEREREAGQQNAIADTINSNIRMGNIVIAQGAFSEVIAGLTDILVVLVAAGAIINGGFSLGMLAAFLAYKTVFVGRSMSLIEQVMTWRLLDVQLERVSDIVRHAAEPSSVIGARDVAIAGAIECRSLGFRYGESDPEVIADLNLSVSPGEFAAIVGASGSGKSTLLKLLSGLYLPTEGDVLIDGAPLRSFSARAIRRQIAIVTQDDQLLAGSIADNICLFDENIDMSRVVESARLACIHAEISGLPMGYQSFVGDMGSALSGGQKQRVMIARALYRQPRILMLDEGTSHLDPETERLVADNLRSLLITRIVVSHRPDTVQGADRTFDLGQMSPRAAGQYGREA